MVGGMILAGKKKISTLIFEGKKKKASNNLEKGGEGEKMKSFRKRGKEATSPGRGIRQPFAARKGRRGKKGRRLKPGNLVGGKGRHHVPYQPR